MKSLTTRWLNFTAIALACTAVGSTQAADIALPPDPSVLQGAELVSFACSKCHGISGNGVSVSPLFPILAGQQSVYLQEQLKLLRQRFRSDPHARAFMWGISRALTDEQIEGVSEYFAKLPPVTGQPSKNPALAAKGKEIYENGVAEPRKVIKCIECHGDTSEGTNTVPRLAGQHQGYMALQLQYYRNKLRVNKLMNRNVQNITDEEIAAVTEYISTLQP